jgi:RimJ/RimL family protein N-acetyltransferase
MPNAARQGIGFEAARKAKDWAFATLNLTTLVSYIDEANAASIALAEKLGAVVDQNAPKCPFEDHLVFRHPKPEAA